MFVFGVGSFATVYVNQTKLSKDGVTIKPNRSTREATTVVHFADVDWYVIGTDGESKMTLLMLDAMTPEQSSSTNAVNYAAGTDGTTVLNQTVATRTLINQSGNIEYTLSEPQEEISNKRLYLLSKVEAENVSSDIRRNILNWWTRDGYYSYPEGLNKANGVYIPIRPSVTVDISNIDLSTGFYNGDTSKKILYMVNRGDVASNKATNVNILPVTIGDITITPNQGTKQIIKLGDYSFYPIGSNGENKVTLLASNNMVWSAWKTTLYSIAYKDSNQYYKSSVNELLNSWLNGAPEGYTASKDLSTFVNAMEPILLNDVATGDIRAINAIDSYYQSNKLFLLSRYEIADLNLSIRKANDIYWFRSPIHVHGGNFYGVYAISGGVLAQYEFGSVYSSRGVRPALVLNLDKVNLTTTTSNGVETITATMK